LTEEDIPSSVLILKFGASFNNKFTKRVLPAKLEFLELGSQYNKEFDLGILPSTLQILILGTYYNKEFDYGVLPHTLQTLCVGSAYNRNFIHVPNSLENLIMDCSSESYNNYLPTQLKYLRIEYVFPPMLNLPIFLQLLEIENLFDGPDIKIPFGCELIIGKNPSCKYKEIIFNYLEKYNFL
jgi:hypothetical protein